MTIYLLLVQIQEPTHNHVGRFNNHKKAILGIFFTTHSAVLITDVPFSQADIHEDPNPPHRVYMAYNTVGYNCFIAAGIYLVIGLFSCCQMRLNKGKNFLVMRQ
ncbi:ribonuclease kappa-A isoform X1 [Synchiropus splendidus]|uniref:ribonuclease kappa-A isoform X1 n=1 Tax=Synchiropus splendidus TaxID=270530 RepID=UPI00237D9912|nr:ribonuclease kappa-A isoform X1 [Synchiropus splendidus]